MERFYKGIPGSRRIAVGQAVVLHRSNVIVPRHNIDRNVESINGEIDKLEEALLKTRAQLEKLKDEISERPAIETGYLDSTMLMLEDPTLREMVEAKITESYLNIE